MQTWYRTVIFCGIMIAAGFFIIAFFFPDPWWLRIGAIWMGACFACATAWIYLAAYQRVRIEMSYYICLYDLRRPKNRSPFATLFSYLGKLIAGSNFLSFTGGILTAMLITFILQDQYETSLFNALTTKVIAGSLPLSEDSVMIRSLRISHDLLAERSAIYNGQQQTDWIDKHIHPLSSDMMTAAGACGSYANVLCRLLQTLNYKTRLLQMKGGNGQICHIIVEARSSHGWVVLDPLYDLYFLRSDGRMASFDDVSHNWTWYRLQVPAGYDPIYSYNDARYTNWQKIPVLMPMLKIMLGWWMNKQEIDHFSLRPYFLRKYKILAYCLFLPVLAFFWGWARRRRAPHVKTYQSSRVLYKHSAPRP